MNLKLVLLSTACLSYFVTHAAAAARSDLLTASVGGDGIYVGADLTGVGLGPLLGSLLGSQSGIGNVVIQAKPGTVAVEAVPPQQVVVQPPVMQQYNPVQPVSLVPVSTISSSYSMTDKLSNLWGGISNVINAKTKAVGDFLRSFRGPPRIVVINADKPTTTTTTHRPPLLQIVALPQQRVYPYRSVPVLEDCDKK